jgi:hypothetical protein
LNEIVDVLIAVGPTVGSAQVVQAAPSVGFAAGYYTDASLGLFDGALFAVTFSRTS